MRVLVVPVLLVALAAGCRTVDRGLARARLPCGLYRWPVKTLADPDVEDIHWEPIDTTVAHLMTLPRPDERRRRHRSTYELYVFRVRAVVAAVHGQVDQDLHVLLRDPDDPKVRLIAEVPSPLCASGVEEASFTQARKTALSIRKRGKPVLVEVTGVGFFDALHKRGASHNGFELHPVLSLIEVAPEAPAPQVAAEAGAPDADASARDADEAEAAATDEPDQDEGDETSP
ncbi:MAG TPA: hypothetical protein VFA98_02920 [Thermoanaerobaculia bacterium]|jgi:hypothetical protein|nr:hypothetical protein [Thermoanaerobaculia bacterium]